MFWGPAPGAFPGVTATAGVSTGDPRLRLSHAPAPAPREGMHGDICHFMIPGAASHGFAWGQWGNLNDSVRVCRVPPEGGSGAVSWGHGGDSAEPYARSGRAVGPAVSSPTRPRAQEQSVSPHTCGVTGGGGGAGQALGAIEK